MPKEDLRPPDDVVAEIQNPDDIPLFDPNDIPLLIKSIFYLRIDSTTSSGANHDKTPGKEGY